MVCLRICIMANMDFSDTFVGACALIQAYCISDHSPAVLKIPMVSKFKHKVFNFLTLLFRMISLKMW